MAVEGDSKVARKETSEESTTISNAALADLKDHGTVF